jgi:outer membrane protein assembly factor BamB
VRAIDLNTGTVRWTHTYDSFAIGQNGPAVGYGRVYVASSGNNIAALDIKTGKELWSTKIAAGETDGVDIQPTVVGGLVLAATVPISLKGQYKCGRRTSLGDGAAHERPTRPQREGRRRDNFGQGDQGS